MSWRGPPSHQASTRERWSSDLNSTLRPGVSGSISTSKPGFGVAQRTSTPAGPNEIAVVPPTSSKVRVSVGVGAVVADVVGTVVVLVVGVTVEVVGVVALPEELVGGSIVLVDGGEVVGAGSVVVVSAVDASGDVVDVLDAVVVVSGAAADVVGDTAGGGSMISSLTTATPALATAIAVAVPSSQRATRAAAFIRSRLADGRPTAGEWRDK